jgi:hypothetical protein
LALAATNVQFLVTITNSHVTSQTERENEANRIVATIARSIAEKLEFKGIQAIHIDYVKRDSGATTRRSRTSRKRLILLSRCDFAKISCRFVPPHP